MPKRIEFSINTLQALLLLAGGAIILILTFLLGVMAGKGGIGGLNLFDKEVKSEIVKMKIDSPQLEQAAPMIAVHDERAAAMNNATSKPVITFYDTLAKPRGKEPLTAKTINESRSEIKDNDRPSRKIYAIQVGAMKDKSLADEMVLKLKKNGYSAYIASSETSGKRIWYKVRLGTFSNKEEARKEAGRIEKNEGISTRVVEK